MGPRFLNVLGGWFLVLPPKDKFAHDWINIDSKCWYA